MTKSNTRREEKIMALKVPKERNINRNTNMNVPRAVFSSSRKMPFMLNSKERMACDQATD